MLILAKPPAVAAPTWSLIAHTGVASGAGSVTTPSIDTTGADLLIVVGSNYTSGLQVSDNKGNTWLAGPSLQDTSAGSELFYCQGGIVGPGHTFTWTGNYGAVTVAAFSGSVANPLDKSNIASGVHNTAVVQPGAITPSQTNTLVVSSATSNYAINSVDSGFTITDNSFLGSSMVTALAYLLPINVVAFNPTWAITANSFDTIALIASFKGTSSGPTPQSFNVSPSLADSSSSAYPNDIVIATNFTASVNGHVTAIKFYKPNTGLGDAVTDTNTSHSLGLWTTDGVRHVQYTTTGEPSGGWVTTPITPYPIVAGTQYVVSFWAAPPTAWVWISGVSGNVSNSSYLVTNTGQYQNSAGDVYPNLNVATDYWYADVVFQIG